MNSLGTRIKKLAGRDVFTSRCRRVGDFEKPGNKLDDLRGLLLLEHCHVSFDRKLLRVVGGHAQEAQRAGHARENRRSIPAVELPEPVAQ